MPTNTDPLHGLRTRLAEAERERDEARAELRALRAVVEAAREVATWNLPALDALREALAALDTPERITGGLCAGTDNEGEPT